MFTPEILLTALANGLMTGAVYALVALGLTLVYGVLHIINFAHGATLTAAMFAVLVCHQVFKIDPYLAILILTPMFFAIGYGVQRFVIGPASHGDDGNILLVTLGLSIIIENTLLATFRSETRGLQTDYDFWMMEVGPMLLPVPRLIAFGGSLLVALLLLMLLVGTDTGKAIRAVAKEKMGAALSGINVEHVYAVTFGLGAACLAIAACLLMPTYLVSPRTGNTFVLVAFTVVVLGGMGSIPGALVGGLFVGVVESFTGFFFGESLKEIGIFLIFILVLLFRPTGLFGAKA